jgi:hypothetical protein
MFEPGRHLLLFALHQKNDLERSVVRCGSEENRKGRAGQLQVEHLKQQEIPSKPLAINAEFEAFRLHILQEFLQLLTAGIDAESLGRLGSTVRDGFSDCPEPNRLEKSSLSPRSFRQADIETSRFGGA